MLITIAIVGIVAAAAVPLLSSNDPQKLALAAEETANLLRFALGEARRSAGYVLVDGKTSAGRLALYNSTASGAMPPSVGTSVINDPLTKRPMVLDVAGNAFSSGVSLTPQFRAGGSARPQLLIGPGLTQMQGFDGGSAGVLQANSGVLLSYSGKSVTVGIDATTGLVTLP